MFNPGETVHHQFIIPFAPGEIAKVIVSYKQDENIVFEKTITSGFEEYVTSARTKFIIALSQQESLLFDNNNDFTAQVNVFTKEGARASSKELKGKNGPQYHREVITSG